MAKFELTAVRRRDVRMLRELGSPLGVELPGKHADSDDPRYPSPRQWRTTLGKALVGLCLIRDDTGGRPTLGSLIKAWLFGALTTVLAVVTG